MVSSHIIILKTEQGCHEPETSLFFFCCCFFKERQCGDLNANEKEWDNYRMISASGFAETLTCWFQLFKTHEQISTHTHTHCHKDLPDGNCCYHFQSIMKSRKKNLEFFVSSSSLSVLLTGIGIIHSTSGNWQQPNNEHHPSLSAPIGIHHSVICLVSVVFISVVILLLAGSLKLRKTFFY